jgi:hypothetical protein
MSGVSSSRVSSQTHTLWLAGTARSSALAKVVLPACGRPDTSTPVLGWRMSVHQ